VENSPSRGLPNGEMIWPVADFHVGFQPREKAGFPAGFRASKLALIGAAAKADC